MASVDDSTWNDFGNRGDEANWGEEITVPDGDTVCCVDV